MIRRRLRTVLWFLKRPRLYPELLYRIKRKLFSRPAHAARARQQAESWCAERAVDTATAVAKITGSPMRTTVREEFHNIFVAAEQQARECPVETCGAADVGLLYWGAAEVSLLYWIAEHSQARKVVETGVAYGWSSLAILVSLAKRPNTMLLSTDMPYPNCNNDEYVGCVVPTELKSRWRVINYPDRQALPKALKELGPIDMCHYDSDKSYEGRMWAYPRLWTSLRSGGFFISDDIADNLAFRDFASALNVDPIVVEREGSYVGILVKQ